VLAVEERPAFQAKNRYSMPAEIPFPKIGAWSVFADAVAGAYTVPPAPAEAVETAIDEEDRLLLDDVQELLDAEAEAVAGAREPIAA